MERFPLEISAWLAPVDSVRRALLEENISATSADEATIPLDQIVREGRRAIAEGLLFDLGCMPNEVIRSESSRALELYRHGHIDHPFTAPWVLFHTWEEGSVVYIIFPGLLPDRGFLACELLPRKVGRTKTLVLGDCALVKVNKDDPAYVYRACGHPSPLRPPATCNLRHVIFNAAHPVLAAMLLLLTENVLTEEVRGRAYDGLGPEKPTNTYVKVKTTPYVTALLNRRDGRRNNVGTHASPVPHLRRGHIRHLHDGRTTWIRDCLVNIADDRSFARSHYTTLRSS